MSVNLVTVLQAEEQNLVAELRETPLFQKIEAIRKVMALYQAAPAAHVAPPQAAPAAPAQPAPTPAVAQIRLADAPPTPATEPNSPLSTLVDQNRSVDGLGGRGGSQDPQGEQNWDGEGSHEGSRAVSRVRAALLSMKVG